MLHIIKKFNVRLFIILITATFHYYYIRSRRLHESLESGMHDQNLTKSEVFVKAELFSAYITSSNYEVNV